MWGLDHWGLNTRRSKLKAVSIPYAFVTEESPMQEVLFKQRMPGIIGRKNGVGWDGISDQWALCQTLHITEEEGGSLGS